MMKKFREMTWGMHAFHLFMFALGAFAMIVFALCRNNPKLEGDPNIMIIPGVGLMGGAILSFILCLFSKPEGQYQKPGIVVQQQEDHELTATH